MIKFLKEKYKAAWSRYIQEDYKRCIDEGGQSIEENPFFACNFGVCDFYLHKNESLSRIDVHSSVIFKVEKRGENYCDYILLLKDAINHILEQEYEKSKFEFEQNSSEGKTIN